MLNNIDLEIPQGKTIALVGESGSGKSTIADLLPRFYDIQEGEILISTRIAVILSQPSPILEWRSFAQQSSNNDSTPTFKMGSCLFLLSTGKLLA